MDLRRIEHFVLLAEELHFGRAARRVYLSQQALSASIVALEKELGVRLFDRTTRSVTLTSSGRRLLPDALALLDRGRAFVRAAARVAEDRPVLRVGLFLGQVAAAELTGPILAGFRMARPEVDLRIVARGFADQWSGLGDEVDLTIARWPLPDREVAAYPLFEEPRVALLAADHAAADADVVTPEMLAVLPVVDVVNCPSPWNAFYQGADLTNDSRPKAIAVRTVEEALLATRLHRLATTTASCTLRCIPWAGVVVRPLEPGTPGSISGIVTDRPGSELVQEFVRVAEDVVATQLALVPDAVLVA